MRRKLFWFLVLSMTVAIFAPAHFAWAEGQMGLDPNSTDINPPPPALVQAQKIINSLPADVRETSSGNINHSKKILGAMMPKINQLLNDGPIPAPPTDPTLCRKRLSANPFLGRATEAPREVASDDAFWSSFRDEFAAAAIPSRDTFFRDSRLIKPVEPTPEVIPGDLCPLQTAVELSGANLNTQFTELNALLISILKNEDINIKHRTAAAESYIAALTILYLQGNLSTSTVTGTTCTQTQLLDANFMAAPVAWKYDIVSFSNDYSLKPLLSKLSCLNSLETLRFAVAFSEAFKMTTAIVASVSPTSAKAVEKEIFNAYFPLMVALFDRTKAVGSGNPLYSMLLTYKKNYIAPQESPSNMSLSIFLSDPKTNTLQTVPICSASIVGWAGDYYSEKTGPSNVPGPVLKSMMKLWLDNYNTAYTAGTGAKTSYGAPINYLQQLASSSTLVAPVWITKDVTPGQGYPSCIYLPNFLDALLHPVFLGDGTCSAWESARLGKFCPYKGVQLKLSAVDKTGNERLANAMATVGEWLMPTAYAEDASPKPQSKCLATDAEKDKGLDVVPCDVPVCPCGFLKVLSCKMNGDVQVCEYVDTKQCGVCAGDGGGVKSEPLTCKQICKYKHGMEYDGGAKTSGTDCYLSSALNEANTTWTVVPKNDSCQLAKAIKDATMKPTEYDLCQTKTSCCGNSIVEDNEACDDGNEITTDGCSNYCTKNDCQSACSFFSGPATKALKAIVDTKTQYHPVYRWLDTSLWLQSWACTLPTSISSPDGKIVLKQGEPCKLAIPSLLKLVKTETAACTKSCQTPSATPSLIDAVKACSAQCQPAMISECKAAKSFHDKMMQPKCVIANGVLKGDNVLCKPNAPCTCGWPYVLEPCTQVVAACKVECSKKINLQSNDEMGKICQEWTMANIESDVATTAVQFFTETIKSAQQVDAFMSQSEASQNAISAVKTGGAEKFNALFDTVMDWTDYENSTKLSAENRQLIKAAALENLKRISNCDKAQSWEVSKAQLKSNFTGAEVLLPLVPLLNEIKAVLPQTQITSKLVTVSEFYKGGTVYEVKAWHTVAEEMGGFDALATVRRAGLTSLLFMSGDTPLNPALELSQNMSLCVNAGTITQMAPDELAKLGAFQAFVAAEQYYKWMKDGEDDSPFLPFTELVDQSINQKVEYTLKQLGVELKETADSNVKTNQAMQDICASYFSGS